MIRSPEEARVITGGYRFRYEEFPPTLCFMARETG